MTPETELPELDPFTEDFQQFPFATLALLRQRAPVHAMAEPGWYIVTTIELAREVLTDPARSRAAHRRPPRWRTRWPRSGPGASDTFRPCC